MSVIASLRAARGLLVALVVAPAFALSSPSPVLAQSVDLPEAAGADTTRDSWVSASYVQQLSSELDDGGSFGRGSLLLGGGHRFRFDDAFGLLANFVYQGSYYDFTDGARPFAWDDVHQLTGVALGTWKLDERWSLQGGGLVRASAESGADWGDAVTGGGILGFGYRASDQLQVGLLLGAVSQIENPVSLLLVPQVDWRFAERWRLHVGLTRIGYTGIGPELSYAPSDAIEIAVGASYQSRRYRLDDHVGIRDGVGQETNAPVYARLGWRPLENVRLDLVAGVSVAGQIRLEDDDGDRLQTSSYDAAPLLGLNGEIAF
jgi:hypothetical protein